MWLKLIAALLVLATTAFAQSRIDSDVRSYFSDDGQRLLVTSRGQILGFERPKACDAPPCSRIGVGLWALPNEGGKFVLANGRFTEKAPPDGTKVRANELKVDVELDVQGTPGLVVEITWRPLSKTAGITVVARRVLQNLAIKAAEESARGRGSKSGTATGRIPIPLGFSLGCECDWPGGYLPPDLSIGDPFGRRAVSQIVPPTQYLDSRDTRVPFLQMSEINWMKPGEGDPFTFELRRKQ